VADEHEAVGGSWDAEVVSVLRLSFLGALPLPVVSVAMVAIVPVVTTPTATRYRGARGWDACCRCAGSRGARSRTIGSGRGDCRRDVAVSRVDAGAKRPQSRDGHERQARQEQCVLNEVLPCVIGDETSKEVSGHRFWIGKEQPSPFYRRRVRIQ
jgi:hypothetical protein